MGRAVDYDFGIDSGQPNTPKAPLSNKCLWKLRGLGFRPIWLARARLEMFSVVRHR
jgi:hypothetical protein